MRTQRNIFLLSGFFVVAGAMHFVIPGMYMRIMPPWIPYPLEMVYVSGVAEMAGGLGLLMPRLRPAAAIGLIALLVAVFPANIQMLSNAIHGDASSLYTALLWLRLPFQPLLIVWIYRSVFRNARKEAELASF
jgi:Predicted membrane protein